MSEINHYDWLEENLPLFFNRLGVKFDARVLISAHGDKGYGYKSAWKKAGIPFEHGMAVYLLSYCPPYSDTIRDTDNGFVAPCQWVIDTYPQVSQLLPKITNE